MDKLKELSIKLGGKIKSQQHLNVNIGNTSFRRLILPEFRSYKVRIDEYKELFSIGVEVNSELSFSINKPDILFSYRILRHYAGATYELYFRDEKYDFDQSDIPGNYWDALFSLLRRIKLSEDESVFF